MKTKQQILQDMSLFRVGGGGIGAWITEQTADDIFDRLGNLDQNPLSAVQLNQLLVLAHEAPVSDGFFRYYWLVAPDSHTYDVKGLPGFNAEWLGRETIHSLDHLRWGLYRLYVDALLYFGNIRTAFRALRERSFDELRNYFSDKRFDTLSIKSRGPALPLRDIPRDQRYLISEMACKSCGDDPARGSRLQAALSDAYKGRAASGQAATTVRELLNEFLPAEFKSHKVELLFTADEILDEQVLSELDVGDCCRRIAARFVSARANALENTRYYLSMLTDLDVYVATSMRSRSDFLRMAATCDAVFSDSRLKPLSLRYFDPTLSAAKGHEDKGLIECLMVKCARALLYCAGDKESYGKDCEAAMALSLGRPVIFYCDEQQRSQFYRDVHPLSRLIEFKTGVAVGAMVTDRIEHIAELLSRLFENRMVYKLEQPQPGFLRLREELTDSVVRLQTNDTLLTETFWNHYHRAQERRTISLPVVDELRSRRVAPTSREPGVQGELLPTGADGLMKVAARSRVSDAPARPANDQASASRVNADAFPWSIEELFDGISRMKRGQAAGDKRFGVFRQWLEQQQLSFTEGAKLLRFVEATIAERKLAARYVYSNHDLTRWYAEMSNGEVVGSRR